MGGRQIEKQPLALEDVEAIRELGARLSEADYTVSGITRLLDEDTVTFTPADIPIHERRLTSSSPISTLVALFLLGLTVDPEKATQALAPLRLGRLEELGLVEPTSGGIRALVELFPYQNLVLACDRKRGPDDGDEGRDFVYGMSPSTELLANLTVRRRAGATLDLGTGCGVQALVAARHSEQVTGVDINPRALNFAAFNALLNGISNVEWREGNLFEPVRGRTFDLIVCNPPFIVSPSVDSLYRDSGHPGDSLCRGIVKEAPDFLREGGFAQVEVSWVFAPDEVWSAPLRGWVEGTGSDAWLLRYRTVDALTYAADANRPVWLRDLARYRQALDRWMAYYRGSGIEVFGIGMIVLRRRSGGTNWIRADELPDPIRPAGDHILRVFRTQDYLQGLASDQAFLESTFALVGDHSLHQNLVCRDGRWQTEEMGLTMQNGLAYRGTIDPPTAHLLSRLDGRRPLGEILAEVAGSKAITGAALASYTSGAVRALRVLLELGFVVPSG